MPPTAAGRAARRGARETRELGPACRPRDGPAPGPAPLSALPFPPDGGSGKTPTPEPCERASRPRLRSGQPPGAASASSERGPPPSAAPSRTCAAAARATVGSRAGQRPTAGARAWRRLRAEKCGDALSLSARSRYRPAGRPPADRGRRTRGKNVSLSPGCPRAALEVPARPRASLSVRVRANADLLAPNFAVLGTFSLL